MLLNSYSRIGWRRKARATVRTNREFQIIPQEATQGDQQIGSKAAPATIRRIESNAPRKCCRDPRDQRVRLFRLNHTI